MEKRKTSWIQENLPQPMRVHVADQIRTHRRDFFRVGAYERGRDFESLLKEEHWDAKEYFQDLIGERPHLNVLEAGAGWLDFSRDVKHAFGDSVYATALNPVFPVPPKNEPQRSEFHSKIRDEVSAQEKIRIGFS